MADLIFRLLSKSESASLLEHNAAKCIGLAAACERAEVRRFLRMLAVDLMMEADRLRRAGSEPLPIDPDAV